MIRRSIESSMLAEEGYDPATGVLEVRFRSNGKVGRYTGVTPEMYQAFQDSPSKGSYLSRIIKPVLPYEEVKEEDLTPPPMETAEQIEQRELPPPPEMEAANGQESDEDGADTTLRWPGIEGEPAEGSGEDGA